LQGITAIGIIVRLLMEYHSFTAPVSAVCDNQGVVSKSSGKIHLSLCTHRATNIDLYLTQKDTLYTHPLLLSWVRGHADKRPWKTLNDLKNQQLSRDEIYNIWCDSLAQRQWSNGDHSSFDPDVLPSERWAVNASFPTTHKFTGSLDQGFNHAIGIRDMCAFVTGKHRITQDTLEKVHLAALGSYLSSLPVFQRASTVKMLHNWIPTYGNLCRQGRSETPICPRCLGTVETAYHVLTCSYSAAVICRSEFLHSVLSSLTTFGTPLYIIATYELKLSATLGLSYTQSYFLDESIPLENRARLFKALQHQNIIGWPNFLRGFIYIYWEELYYYAHESSGAPRNVSWSVKMVEGAIDLYRKIWSDHNSFIHGATSQESQVKLRDQILSRVRQIYPNPPKLHKRFSRVTNIPLQVQLQRNTTNFQRWLSRIQHQIHVMKFISQTRGSNQLSLCMAYQRGNVDLPPVRKFLP
jgi:hypothetical protein